MNKEIVEQKEEKEDAIPEEPQAPEKPTRRWEWLPADGKHDYEE